MSKQLGVELLVDNHGQLVDEEGFYYETYFTNENEAYAYCYSSKGKFVYPLVDSNGNNVWAVD